jgi:hypothetical protein
MSRKKKAEHEQARQFALALAGVLAVLGGVFWYGGHPLRAATAAVGAGVVVLCAFLAQRLWLRVFRRWMTVAERLSWIMTLALLTAFFYGVLTPMALLMRLTGRKPLDLDWKDGRPTYWIDRAPVETSRQRYERQF